MVTTICVGQIPNLKKYGLLCFRALLYKHFGVESKNKDSEIACLSKLSIFSS